MAKHPRRAKPNKHFAEDANGEDSGLATYSFESFSPSAEAANGDQQGVANLAESSVLPPSTSSADADAEAASPLNESRTASRQWREGAGVQPLPLPLLPA